jgi:flagellar protein FliT
MTPLEPPTCPAIKKTGSDLESRTAQLLPQAMTTKLLNYYQAIERASADMLEAARSGDWDQVVKLEGACVLLISQLKHAAQSRELEAEEAKSKSRIMQRILLNDAEIRYLSEPWLEDLDRMMLGRSKTLH